MSGHSGQQLLIPAPASPADWCASWGIELLEEIPVPGLAPSKDLAALPAHLRTWPGRNHPRALRPTGYQQWKVAKDPRTPWIKTEWAVVARPGSCA